MEFQSFLNIFQTDTFKFSEFKSLKLDILYDVKL